MWIHCGKWVNRSLPEDLSKPELTETIDSLPGVAIFIAELTESQANFVAEKNKAITSQKLNGSTLSVTKQVKVT